MKIEKVAVGETFPCKCKSGLTERVLPLGRGYREVRCVCGRRYLINALNTGWRVISDPKDLAI